MPAEVPGVGVGARIVWLKSTINDYGLFWVYPMKPSFIPNAKTVEDVCDSPSFYDSMSRTHSGGWSGIGGHPIRDVSPKDVKIAAESSASPYEPFDNASISEAKDSSTALVASVSSNAESSCPRGALPRMLSTSFCDASH